ncbi:MAG: metallophosphoesterase family protein [Candidatus Thermoplasmatota archaeon]|nr:metallophosphoesterase family protein [Candidatus Thermoplasmatota archaeon]MBS3790637.1 metallophosphoesterase family protein [Candidatus Thermoplasmatota archaeon]
MRILLISDVHGNYEALKEVLAEEEYDRLYCMGDIVDYGPSNQKCVQAIRDKADFVVRGNHDNAVAFGVDCGCGYEIKELSQEVRKITVEDISEESKDYLRELPMTESTEDHFLTHASKDDLYKYLKPDTSEEEFEEFKDIDQDLVFLGHTHIPMDRKINGRRYINPGSLGQPRDGDTRAAYVVLEDGEITFERLEYDIGSVVEKMRGKDYPERAIRILKAGEVVD